MTTPPIRPAAVSLLSGVLDQRQMLDDLLAQDGLYQQLEGPDKGLARAITSAVLRQLGQIDYLIDQHLTGRKIRALDRTVQHILRVGVAQICVLKTPLHAAVSETVEAARAFEDARKAGGLVNAVLRKLGPDSLTELGWPAERAWPKWFRDMTEGALGQENARHLAEAMQETPPLDITVRSDLLDWAERLNGEALCPHTVRLTSGNVTELAGYSAGDWWIQDFAATLPVHILAPKAGERVLDLCAAPGGKTMQIAATGANVTAIDRSAKRLERVKANLRRTGLKADCVVADAAKWRGAEPFDAVLLDPPCSALGTLRRHPEGPWIKQKADLDRFPEIQARLLAHAANLVKPGGRLVYCVCTPLPFEGVNLVERFLSQSPNWQRQTLSQTTLSGAITDKGDLLTLPPILKSKGGADAFYIAALERVG